MILKKFKKCVKRSGVGYEFRVERSQFANPQNVVTVSLGPNKKEGDHYLLVDFNEDSGKMLGISLMKADGPDGGSSTFLVDLIGGRVF